MQYLISKYLHFDPTKILKMGNPNPIAFTKKYYKITWVLISQAIFNMTFDNDLTYSAELKIRNYKNS